MSVYVTPGPSTTSTTTTSTTMTTTTTIETTTTVSTSYTTTSLSQPAIVGYAITPQKADSNFFSELQSMIASILKLF